MPRSPEYLTLAELSKLKIEHPKEVRSKFRTGLRDMISTATENLHRSQERDKRNFDTTFRVRRLPDVDSYVHLRKHRYREARGTPGEKFSPKLRREASGLYKAQRTNSNTPHRGDGERGSRRETLS